MSAITKLYATRASDARNAGTAEKPVPNVYTSKLSDAPDNVQRRIGIAKALYSNQHSEGENNITRQEIQSRDFKVALSIIESVNLGFTNLLNRLEESEAIGARIAADFEEQCQYINQIQFELEETKKRVADAEAESTELADLLTAETARALASENKVKQAEAAANFASQRIADIEEDCRSLHDGIISAFGVGSPTHRALNSLSSR